jgi:hypothetical protein
VMSIFVEAAETAKLEVGGVGVFSGIYVAF